MRKYLPGTTLASNHLDAIDKCMALLWAVFNIIGTMVAMERFLMAVRSISTDFGTESVIANIPNCFREFAAR
eukprot:9230290-Pyramimonas_sp.AAC.1